MNATDKVNRLIEEGVAPDAEYYAAAGREYGWVKAWLLGDRYVVQYGDNSNTYADFADDADDLASWIEYDISGLDLIVQTANVRGADAVPEADESADGPFYVMETRYWYGATEESSIVTDDRGLYAQFASIEEARAWIDDVENRPYWLLHNESGRPSYKVVSA